MESCGKVALTLIEVQTGSYLEDGDIIRHENVYGRDEPAEGSSGLRPIDI